MEIHSLERFIEAQDRMYALALKELRAGKKRSHWIWYIFPQLRGLGTSRMSYIYGIADMEEARAYLAHPILAARLTEACEVLLRHTDKAPEEILGDMDAKKLQSSLTLFALVSEAGEASVFYRVLHRYYSGRPDRGTLALLGVGGA